MSSHRTTFNHVGLCVSDRERSRRFYEGVLGLTFVADDGFALVFRSGTNMVRLAKMPDNDAELASSLGIAKPDGGGKIAHAASSIRR